MSRRLPLGRLSGVRRLSAESRLTGKRQISNEAAPHATTTLSFLGSHIVGVVCLRREMPHKFTELAWRAFLANWRAARLRASAQPSKSHRASAIDLECGAQSNWRARNWNRAHFCQTHTRQKCSLSLSLSLARAEVACCCYWPLAESCDPLWLASLRSISRQSRPARPRLERWPPARVEQLQSDLAAEE